MNNIKTWFIWLFCHSYLLFTLDVRNSTFFISFINILFYISLVLFILLFLILLVQEGIFDATSFGFRRMRYQLASRSKKNFRER